MVKMCKGGDGSKFRAIKDVDARGNDLSDSDAHTVAEITLLSIKKGWETKHKLAELCGNHPRRFSEEDARDLMKMFLDSKNGNWESKAACASALAAFERAGM